MKRVFVFLTLLYLSLSLFAKTEKTYLNMTAEVFSRAYVYYINDKINISSNTKDYIIECITGNGDLIQFDKTLNEQKKIAIIKVSSL